jgi:hypothetical protein
MENNDNLEQKTINITGTHNKYQMNKLIKERKTEPKKREVSKKWSFPEEYYNYEKQMKLINAISIKNLENKLGNNLEENLENKLEDEITQTVIQEINKKIYGYKHQDILKKKLDANAFIDFNCVIQKMIECELKCRYCKCVMSVLYDITREMKQWSVDRIDNDKGHNKDNFHLACLDCNLKRRRRTYEKFLFTKQLNIVKNE